MDAWLYRQVETFARKGILFRRKQWTFDCDDLLQEVIIAVWQELKRTGKETTGRKDLVRKVTSGHVKNALRGQRLWAGKENRSDAFDLPAAPPTRCPDCGPHNVDDYGKPYRVRKVCLCRECYERSVRQDASYTDKINPEVLPVGIPQDSKLWAELRGAGMPKQLAMMAETIGKNAREARPSRKETAKTAKQYTWNKETVAKLLGISKPTLLVRINQLREYLMRKAIGGGTLEYLATSIFGGKVFPKTNPPRIIDLPRKPNRRRITSKPMV